MKFEEITVDVSSGFILIAIKIPTTKCAACDAVYTPVVNPKQVRQLIEQSHSLDHAILGPTSSDGWQFVSRRGPNVAYKNALVCRKCGEELLHAKIVSNEAEEAANAAVASRVKNWEG